MEEFDVAVIGAGSAGPKAARISARQGMRVAIFEESLIGGECLYTGCVPSKSIIHSARLWHQIKGAHAFGLPKYSGGEADFAAVMNHARLTVEQVGSGSAVDSFAKAGITTICERAAFVDPYTVITNKTKRTIKAKAFILCTGSLPTIPNIPGLEEAGYDTNRTVFEYKSLPKRMVVLGGGPIGCELGQVFARFGSQVTLLHRGPRILSRDSAEAAQVLHDSLIRDGMRIVVDVKIERVEKRGEEKILHLSDGEEIACDAILISAGRHSNVEGLNLDAAGVEVHGSRLRTSSAMQTNVPHIWAAGDITTEYQFTHVVSYEGAVAALNACAHMEGKPFIEADYRVIPRVTYTDPEVASVGLTPAIARNSHGAEAIDVARFAFADLDRAIITGDTEGFVQIVSLVSDGTIIGAQIAGSVAGSLISEICLAMRARLSVQDIALTMHAYPTMPEAVEAAAYHSCHAPLSPNIPREMLD